MNGLTVHSCLCLFCLFVCLLQKMVRDKRNYNQLTESQLMKKCQEFHVSAHVSLLHEPDSA